MSYTQVTPNSTRFSILGRTTTATLSKGSTYSFQTNTTVGGVATGTVQPSGSLIIAELRSEAVNADPATEWYINNSSFFTKALDQEPDHISSIGGNAYACAVANGSAANSIYITYGGVQDVNEVLMTGTHAISYS